jgi:FkbM family methyltransferase
MFSRLKRKVAEFLQWQTALGSGSLEIRSTLATLAGRFEGVGATLTALERAVDAVGSALETHVATLSMQLATLSTGVATQITAMGRDLDLTRKHLASLQSRPDNFYRLYGEDREELRRQLALVRGELPQQVQQLSRLLDDLPRAIEAEQAQRLAESRRVLTECGAAIEQAVASRLLTAPQRYAYLGDHLAFCTTVDGHRLFIDTRDRQIAPHLATHGLREPWNTRIFRALLREGDTVVDVGSNVGTFVMLAAHLVGSTGRVVALEANPAVADLLRASVEINGFADRVALLCVAASDHQGFLRFTTYANHLGDGHIETGTPVHTHPGGSTIEVPTSSLDAAIEAPQRNVRLLHVDAEGAEPLILRGARELVQASPDLVILMKWGLTTQGRVEELTWLASLGFRFARVAHDTTFSPCTVADLATSGLCDVLCFRGDLPVGAS